LPAARGNLFLVNVDLLLHPLRSELNLMWPNRRELTIHLLAVFYVQAGVMSVPYGQTDDEFECWSMFVPRRVPARHVWPQSRHGRIKQSF